MSQRVNCGSYDDDYLLLHGDLFFAGTVLSLLVRLAGLVKFHGLVEDTSDLRNLLD